MTDKSPNPDFFYGISLKLSYKNWDFGFNGHFELLHTLAHH